MGEEDDVVALEMLVLGVDEKVLEELENPHAENIDSAITRDEIISAAAI